MNNNKSQRLIFKPAIMAIGFVLALAFGTAPMANAASNPFSSDQGLSGYTLAGKSTNKAKCGSKMKACKCPGSKKDGKCGASKKDGKCGANKKEGKCGANKKGKNKGKGKGKCGAGKCTG